MAAKKVYDLAKEYDIQSKDFVSMLQQAEIPVKNHMSAISEQQEKYFRNNFDIIEGKVVAKGEAAEKSAQDTAAGTGSEKKEAEKPRPVQRAKAAPSDAPTPAKAQEEAKKPEGAIPSLREQARQNTAARLAAQQNHANSSSRQHDSNRDDRGYRQRGEGGYNGQNRNQNASGGQNRGGYNNQNRQGGYQGRDDRQQGGANQGSGQRNGYQGNRPYNPNYKGNQGAAGQGQGGANQGSGQRSGYQGNRPYNPNYKGNQGAAGQGQGGYSQGSGQRSGYQGNRPYNPNYKGPQGSRPSGAGGAGGRGGFNQGGWDKDKQGAAPYQQRGGAPGARKPAGSVEKPMEKSSKIDKTKKESKQRNEQRSKAKENFFTDDKPLRGIDNTKKTHGSKSDYKKKKLEAWEERATGGVEGVVVIPESITISELSESILISAADIIKILMSYGIMANVNQTIDFETASVVCEELGIEVKLEEEEDVVEAILARHFADEDKLMPRPPIVTVMGHVDHGKTSLLDAIRKTNVISGEAGGITQHIGAYTITLRGRSITFIDTPGHAAFTAMRSRGASVTDIAILVVAADDGVMPQTIEAINHAKAAGVPIIVAINKIDKPAANPDKVKQELTEYGLVAEEWGGETICANISAKNSEGIENLLDMILLVAEVEDLKANFDEKAIGTVIESKLDKQRGVTATLLIKSGVLNDGDYIVMGDIYGKVRVMTDDKGRKLDSAGPSAAVEMIGLNEVPAAGDKFYVAESEKEAKKVTDARKNRAKLLAMKGSSPVSLDDLFERINQGELKELNLIVKADVHGSFEAIKQSLEKLNENKDGIKLSVIHGGVGAVTETDVSLAYASNALVIGFNVTSEPSAKTMAARDNVEIRSYSVIYNIIEDIQAAMKGMLDPEFEEVVTANAEVRQIFKVPGLGTVCGSYVLNGTITRSDKVRVVRNGVFVYDGTIGSLKRFKDDVKDVATGFECGIGIEKFNDVKEGDSLQFYKIVEKER